MARRYRGNMNGERYCGDASSKEVHDLDREQPECQIDATIDAGNDRPFYALSAAYASGYEGCARCLVTCRCQSG